jgi:uroporphyrin-III C-methyltransferase
VVASAAKAASTQAVPAAWWLVAVVLAVLATAATVFAWNTQQRVKGLERELVKRQEDSGSAAAEARLVARQAQESARDVSAKLALVEARVSESSIQRSQLEELMQSLSRSRDENVLADVEAALRVAMQLTALTGSSEPLLGALRQAEERLARYSQPRLERVRRALAHDLERAKTAGLADVASLSIRLDEAVRLVDSLPLISVPEGRLGPRDAVAAPAPAPAASAAPAKAPGWNDQFRLGLQDTWARFWGEVRGLVRVTRIDHPEAMLSAPDQTFFLRENLKLRLLNARLALLSRQFETAQADLRVCQDALVKYFDPQARRTQSAVELLRQVQSQARAVNLPRPDETLAAIAAAGR